MLLPLTLMLVGPYVILSVLERICPRLSSSRSFKGRLGVSLFLLGPAVSHFASADAMQHMLPPSVPWRLEIIYITGVFEFLGAVGIWIPRLMGLMGILLILMLLCFLPANIYASLMRVEYGGSSLGPLYLLIRVPFQFFVIWWVYWSTDQNWSRINASAEHGGVTHANDT